MLINVINYIICVAIVKLCNINLNSGKKEKHKQYSCKKIIKI